MQPSAAVISFSPLHRDARVQRQIRVLKSICNVTAIGFTDPGIDGVRFINVSPRLGTRPERAVKVLEQILRAFLLKAESFEIAYRLHGPVRRTAHTLKDHNFALIVANDIDTLPIALMHRGRAKVLFDAHEYAPRQFENRFLWRFFLRKYIRYLCRTRIPQTDAMTTVGSALAEMYAKEFGIRPAVVLNTPRYHAIPYAPRHGKVIRMVHHGGAIRYRRLETMIDAMSQLDERFRLDLMLIPNDPTYVEELRNRASCNPRIALVSPVAPDEIVERISCYDVGLYNLAPYSFNARHALPNKFFDFLQARLCVAIGPSPEMTKFVSRYSCGIVANDFTAQALTEALNKLDRQRVETCRRATDVAASELCYERSAKVFEDAVRTLLDLVGKDGRASILGHGAPTGVNEKSL